MLEEHSYMLEEHSYMLEEHSYMLEEHSYMLNQCGGEQLYAEVLRSIYMRRGVRLMLDEL